MLSVTKFVLHDALILFPYPAWPLVDGALFVSKRRSPDAMICWDLHALDENGDAGYIPPMPNRSAVAATIDPSARHDQPIDPCGYLSDMVAWYRPITFLLHDVISLRVAIDYLRGASIGSTNYVVLEVRIYGTLLPSCMIQSYI